MQKTITLLVVEDEDNIREVIASYLEREGYRVLQAENGREALAIFEAEAVDLIILDLMLPDLDGETALRHIRAESELPILILTAKADEEDRIHGFRLGADDYLVKPFSPRELVERAKAILRRTDPSASVVKRASFAGGQLQIDYVSQKVIVRGEEVTLTPSEFRLLAFLSKYPKRPFSRETLIEKLAGFDYEGDARTIDQHVKNIRRKIEPDPRRPQYIITVYGLGYKFAVQPDAV